MKKGKPYEMFIYGFINSFKMGMMELSFPRPQSSMEDNY